MTTHQAYFGDIHNHCAIGYGHGTIDDSFQNARMQLDFACVTCHAWWPDLPDNEERLAAVAAYHRNGFAVTARAWQQVQEVVAANHVPDRFVTFLGHEWHNCAVGDHNVYYRDGVGEILRAATLDEMRATLRRLQADGVAVMLLPHHIGYRQGYRGINWAAYSAEFSPVVEIMSMHGCAESAEAPRPYLHTMGPRNWESTYQYGLAQGHIVGVKGSTDHHSAHPGSYGHGRLGLWAEGLTRAAIWEAIQARRTYALTGDNIRLQFALNEQPMGSVLAATPERAVTVDVRGGGALDYVELLHNNRVIERLSRHQLLASLDDPYADSLQIHFEVGWAERNEDIDWDVTLTVTGGELQAVEPRFRGHEVVAPSAEEAASYAFSQWQQQGDKVHFRTRTWGNPTTTTPSTQGVNLTISGDHNTVIQATVNGQAVTVPLARLLDGPLSGYLGGFLTPCYYFHRAVPAAEATAQLHFTHRSSTRHGQSRQRDWYYVRVRQTNDQWAWSSPIWVEG
ncbi:MAG TPA: hypothetical protein P5121_37065 [Caldilineaceae bacterium]|nr:hypothetical protein [Caldilineaceae bacterium]